jgi:F0F1-type ATP synthase membrane subunit b/b'
MMGFSFPNPIRAAQNFASGVQKSFSNNVQSAQKSFGNAVTQTKNFASQQINSVQKQAQSLQNQAGSFASNAQKSLSNAYQSNVVKPLQQAKSQIGSSFNSAQKSLNNSYQSNVAKPLSSTQNQMYSSFQNTQKSLTNTFQSKVVKPFQNTQSQLSNSFNNTQKSLSQSFQSNVVKPFQATQNKIEQRINNTQKQIGQTTQQLQKNFSQSLQSTQKQLGLTPDSIQKQLNTGLAGKTGYERFSQIADNVLTGGEKFGKKLANFNQVGGIPRNTETYKLNVLGEGINLASGLSKGIGSVINGTPKWFSDAKDLATGNQQFSKKDAAAAAFSSFGKFGYGLVSGVGDLASRVVAPGKGHEAYANASSGLQKSLDDSYRRDVAKIGVNPNSTTYKTVNNGLDVAAAVGSLFLPGGKAVKGGGALVRVEQGATATSRAVGATEALSGLERAVGNYRAGKIGASELNSALSEAQGAYRARSAPWSAEQKAGLARTGVEAQRALANKVQGADKTSSSVITAEQASTVAAKGNGGARGGATSNAANGSGSSAGVNSGNAARPPGGVLVKPTPSDAIRSTLSWLRDVQGPSAPAKLKAPADLVSARDRVNELLTVKAKDGSTIKHSPQSLNDRQAAEVYRGLTRSEGGSGLSKNQTYMEQLSNRFSSSLSGQKAKDIQRQFNAIRQELMDAHGTSTNKNDVRGRELAQNRALARVDVNVNPRITGRGYDDTFFTTSGEFKAKDMSRLPAKTYATETTKSNGVRNHAGGNLHEVYPSTKNPRLFEAEAAAIQQVEKTLSKLEKDGALVRDANNKISGRGVNVDIALDRISCPSCGAGVPEWLNKIRAEYPNININVHYLK